MPGEPDEPDDGERSEDDELSHGELLLELPFDEGCVICSTERMPDNADFTTADAFRTAALGLALTVAPAFVTRSADTDAPALMEILDAPDTTADWTAPPTVTADFERISSFSTFAVGAIDTATSLERDLSR